MWTLAGIFSGRLQAFGPRGKPSGINKAAIEQAEVATPGLVGDHQGDKRFHGGPDKAVHHYPAEHYQMLTTVFPGVAERAVPGSLGENLSTTGLLEHQVCIGDVFQVGDVRLQVSGPRIPCWKIAHKLDQPEADKLVAEQGITGWYYRVLQGGVIARGDSLVLVERSDAAVTIAEFMDVVERRQRQPAAIRQARDSQGLDPLWIPRLEKRLASVSETP